MKYKFNRYDAIGTAVIFLVLLIIFLTNLNDEEKTIQYISNYKDLKINTQIHGIIENAYYPEEWRGGRNQQYITLQNGQKLNVYVKEFLKSQSKDLRSFVKPDAKITKQKGSDTIIISYKGKHNLIKIYTKEE